MSSISEVAPPECIGSATAQLSAPERNSHRNASATASLKSLAAKGLVRNSERNSGATSAETSAIQDATNDPLAGLEELRAAVEADLNRTGLQRAFRTRTNGSVVLLVIAIRDAGSGAILISGPKWDGVRCLDLMDKHQPPSAS